MAKVLIVDDEPDIELLAKQKFRKLISNGTFELLFAQNGQEALDLIKKEPNISVVVSDVNMPQMDGLTLIDKLKAVSPTTKTIIVSAYGDTKTLRAAMNRGVFDFVTKPVDFNELRDVILRTLTQYQPLPTPLYTYQLLLADAFPERIDLNYSHEENTLLWDAFLLDSLHMIVIGVSIVPSLIPFEMGLSAAHSLLKLALKEEPNLPLTTFQEKLSKINPSLKAHVLAGFYHLESHVFSYQTTGEFKVHHLTSEEETFLKPSQTKLLALGDVITLGTPPSASRLSLTRIHKG